MGGSKKEIKNDRRSVPIVLHKEREEWNSNSNLPEGFIPIKINMIKSPGDYQKCINCEERITISTSIMTTKQMIKKNEITDQIKSEKSLNIPVQKVKGLGNRKTISPQSAGQNYIFPDEQNIKFRQREINDPKVHHYIQAHIQSVLSERGGWERCQNP